jgi:hypothetical protein
MSDSAFQAHEVLLALREYDVRISEIMNAIGDKRSVSVQEKQRLQAMLSTLKSDIKAAAKREKIYEGRQEQSAVESVYFAPALRGASANFRVATNSHPINSGWHSCLYDVRIDITYYLHQLEEQYPNI